MNSKYYYLKDGDVIPREFQYQDPKTKEWKDAHSFGAKWTEGKIWKATDFEPIRVEIKSKSEPKPTSKYIVVNENTLCYQVEGSNFPGVLAGSVVRGGHDPKNGAIVLSSSDVIRDATLEDFKEYRVQFPTDFMNEIDKREYLMSRIEGMAGTLHSVPWDKISTEDMQKLYDALMNKG